jgi:hypothetical protein
MEWACAKAFSRKREKAKDHRGGRVTVPLIDPVWPSTPVRVVVKLVVPSPFRVAPVECPNVSPLFSVVVRPPE